MSPLVAHVLIGWGFWLSGIAVGYIAAKRDWMRATRVWAIACLRRADEAESRALESTMGGVDLGPWIAQCKEESAR